MAGDYWLANNFIWGVILLPTLVLADIIKSRAARDDFRLSWYIISSGAFGLAMVCLRPLYAWYIKYVMFAENVEAIVGIVNALLPFYLVFMIGSVFEAYFIGKGKTGVTLVANLATNLVYYPIATGIFAKNIDGICSLFGRGIVVTDVVLVIAYFARIRYLHYR